MEEYNIYYSLIKDDSLESHKYAYGIIPHSLLLPALSLDMMDFGTD